MKYFAKAIIACAMLAGAAACGSDEVDTQRLPEAPVLETTVPGIIFLRGPDGEFVPGNQFPTQDEVHLVGTGLEDGEYFYQVVDSACELQLAHPRPTDPNVPVTSDDIIVVRNGTFGPLPIAPFLSLPPDLEFYAVYLTPVTSLSDDMEVGCFGFPELESLTADFRVDLATQPVAPR